MGARSDVPQVRWITADELPRLARAYGGKATLFNIWATWCASCRGEVPELQALGKKYASQGISVVLVSVDEPEQHDKLVDWIVARGFTPPAWAAARPLGTFKKGLAASWQGNIPVTFLFDSEGKRRYFWDGPVSPVEISPIVDGLLAGKSIDGEKHFALSAGAHSPDAVAPAQ